MTRQEETAPHVRLVRGARAGTVPHDILWNLGLFQASIFVFVGLLPCASYRLDRHRHAEIVRALDRRQTAAAEPGGLAL